MDLNKKKKRGKKAKIRSEAASYRYQADKRSQRKL
jgi:hypothetical protein